MSNPNPEIAKLSLWSIVDIVHSRSGLGNNFNGEAPSGAISVDNNRFVWAESADQGLVDPVGLGLRSSFKILRVILFMAGQSTWKIELIDGTNAHTLASGTTEASVQQLNLGYLINGQKLKVTTTGAGTTSVKMVCTLVDVSDKLAI
jgi:hypothetical protein